MRLQRHSDDYRTFLFELANQIVASVEEHPLPEGQRRSTCAPRRARSTTRPSGDGLAGDGDQVEPTNPMMVHFIVAASTADEMSTVRQT